jgi:hypothetical protein
MKHILIFQGKKYISSKRASKVSDYSSDYIGQLCRSGKLDAKMFGHTWFITEESLSRHMGTVSSPDAFKARIQNLQKASKKGSTDLELGSNEADEAVGRISGRRAAELTGYSADYIGQLCRSGKLDAKMIGHTWYVSQDSLYEYVRKLEQEQRAAEFQKLSRQAATASKKNNSVGGAVASPYQTVSASTLRAARSASRVGVRTSHPIRNSFFAVCFVVIFVLAASMSITYIGGAGNVAVNNSSVAGVYSAAQAVVAFFNRQYEAIVARIIKSRDLTVRTPDAVGVQGTEYGMVVSPSSGNTDEDAARTKAIKDSFSDDVAIHPDQSGTAGVITPVFRKSNGKDFMYVLVPVKSGNKANGNSP